MMMSASIAVFDGSGVEVGYGSEPKSLEALPGEFTDFRVHCLVR